MAGTRQWEWSGLHVRYIRPSHLLIVSAKNTIVLLWPVFATGPPSGLARARASGHGILHGTGNKTVKTEIRGKMRQNTNNFVPAGVRLSASVERLGFLSYPSSSPGHSGF